MGDLEAAPVDDEVNGEEAIGAVDDDDSDEALEQGVLESRGIKRERRGTTDPVLDEEQPRKKERRSSASASPPREKAGKLLPTPREHTSTRLDANGDEYLAREIDMDGESKIDSDGVLQDERKYKVRTFCLPDRAQKLFMVATECARVLGYRDSYLFFNKNRSLYKIIASQTEKEALIHQDLIPYSYRSRQIALVTARSVFRQFGSRVIHSGRRVKDDYWENKAIKQGFTEADAAGEKRPGPIKVESVPRQSLSLHIIYDDVPLSSQPALASARLPLCLQQAPPRNYGQSIKQRQDTTGPPYIDRTLATPAAEIMHQATNATELSRAISHQRNVRHQIYTDLWRRKIEPPSPPPPAEKAMPQSASPYARPLPAAYRPQQSPPRQQYMPAPAQQPYVVLPPNAQYQSPQQAYAHTSPRPRPTAQHRTASGRFAPTPNKPPGSDHARPSGGLSAAAQRSMYQPTPAPQYPAQPSQQYAPQYPAPATSQYPPQYASQHQPQYPAQQMPQYPPQPSPQYPPQHKPSYLPQPGSQYAPQYPPQSTPQFPAQGYSSQSSSQYPPQQQVPQYQTPGPPMAAGQSPWSGYAEPGPY